MNKTTLIIRGQPAPQGGGHHGLRHPTRPVVIRNMQGEVIARLGEEQGIQYIGLFSFLLSSEKIL